MIGWLRRLFRRRGRKPTIRTVRSGHWEDPAIWDAGRVPGDGDSVVIGRGHHITIDSGRALIGSMAPGEQVGITKRVC